MTIRNWLSVSTTRSVARLARPLGATVLLGVLLLGLSMVDGTVPRAHAQKGGGGNPPPVAIPQNVKYTLKWLDGGLGWEALSPRDINQWGDVVGPAQALNAPFGSPGSAFAYRSSTGGPPFNLNNRGAVWLDLNAPTRTSVGGWWASDAYGVNDDGDIVGSATNLVNTNLPIRAYVLVNAFGLTPEFWLLPTIGLGLPIDGAGSHHGRRINNRVINNNGETVLNGEAVGAAYSGNVSLGVVRYMPTGATWPYYEAILAIPSSGIDGIMDINDDGVVVARKSSSGSYRQLGNGATDFVDGHEFWAISNGVSGVPAMISGLRYTKKGLTGGAFRLPVTGNVSQIIYPGSGYARAINDYGDTVVEASGRGFLYYDPDSNPNTPNPYGTNGNGILPLDKLVVNQNGIVPNKEADWLDGIRLDGINNRDATGFGQICGRAPGIPRGFLLTPYVPGN